jgi:YaiO family outer membrane protein
MTFAAIALTIAAVTASPVPSPTPTPMTWIEAGGSLSNLTNNRGNWQCEYVATGTTRGRREFDAELLRTQRFGAGDNQVLLGSYWPTSPATIAHVEVDWSPTHRILPQLAFVASLEHRLDRGWGYILGLGARSYPGLGVQTQSIVVDRYWKSFRAAYTIVGAQLSNVPGVAVDHAVSFTHYYDPDQRSAITLSAAFGRDVENVGSGVLVSRTLELTAGGTHRFGSDSLLWSISSVAQGTLYHRTQVDIGLRRTF